MTAQIAAWGRLGSDPRALETKSGKPMTVATIAVEVGDDEEPEWLGIVAFGTTAETLARHAKGDCLSVSGRLQRRTYSTREGEQRQQLQIVADSLVSARSVRPAGKKRQQPQQQQPQQPPLEQARELYGEPDPF